MSMISLSHVTFGYAGSYDLIFDDVSLVLDSDWRLGLIGRNGRGKTTLLKLLNGTLKGRGQIFASVPFAYFPYPILDRTRLTEAVLEVANPQVERWMLLKEFAKLKLSPDLLYRPFCTLSGGEQTKAMLGALFAGERCFLLIDEPTNHLDAEARALVGRYLRQKSGFILVSHDRELLDGCVDHILSINRANLELQQGNFSSWYANHQAQEQFEQMEYEKQKREIVRLDTAARRTAGWSDKTEKRKYGADVADRGYVGHKSAKMMKRAKSIAARRTEAAEKKRSLLKNVETNDAICLHPIAFHTRQLVSLENVAIQYDGKTVSKPVNLRINAGDRIALCGRNGCGKSSILKRIAGQAICHTGTVQIGTGLVVSYVPQDTSFLKGRLADFIVQSGVDKSLYLTILRKLGFLREQFDKDMCDFSAGQKKKALLARSLCKQAHLYLWDEPLNYIDVFSRMQIEEMLAACDSTIVFVEHDAAFVKKVATQIVTL